MSVKEINLKIDEITSDYMKLLKMAKTTEEKKRLFETYYKILLTFEKIKSSEVRKILWEFY